MTTTTWDSVLVTKISNPSILYLKDFLKWLWYNSPHIPGSRPIELNASRSILALASDKVNVYVFKDITIDSVLSSTWTCRPGFGMHVSFSWSVVLRRPAARFAFSPAHSFTMMTMRSSNVNYPAYQLLTVVCTSFTFFFFLWDLRNQTSRLWCWAVSTWVGAFTREINPSSLGNIAWKEQ